MTAWTRCARVAGAPARGIGWRRATAALGSPPGGALSIARANLGVEARSLPTSQQQQTALVHSLLPRSAWASYRRSMVRHGRQFSRRTCTRTSRRPRRSTSRRSRSTPPTSASKPTSGCCATGGRTATTASRGRAVRRAALSRRSSNSATSYSGARCIVVLLLMLISLIRIVLIISAILMIVPVPFVVLLRLSRLRLSRLRRRVRRGARRGGSPASPHRAQMDQPTTPRRPTLLLADETTGVRPARLLLLLLLSCRMRACRRAAGRRPRDLLLTHVAPAS